MTNEDNGIVLIHIDMIKDLTFITSNANKAKQLEKYLQTKVNHQSVDLIEIQSLDITEVVEHKVREAYKQIKKPVIVDDSGFNIHAFGKLPGTFIKYFWEEIGYEKICKMLNIFEDRSATGFTGIGFYDGKTLKVFTGEIKGVVADMPKDGKGFSFDVVFIPDGYDKRRSEMNDEEYDATSPRRIALEKLYKFLESFQK